MQYEPVVYPSMAAYPEQQTPHLIPFPQEDSWPLRPWDYDSAQVSPHQTHHHYSHHHHHHYSAAHDLQRQNMIIYPEYLEPYQHNNVKSSEHPTTFSHQLDYMRKTSEASSSSPTFASQPSPSSCSPQSAHTIHFPVYPLRRMSRSFEGGILKMPVPQYCLPSNSLLLKTESAPTTPAALARLSEEEEGGYFAVPESSTVDPSAPSLRSAYAPSSPSSMAYPLGSRRFTPYGESYRSSSRHSSSSPNPPHRQAIDLQALPVPVPNLHKKSRGRHVPLVTNNNSCSDGESQSRQFTCPAEGCLKCFARYEHLRRHVRSIHTHEKPFTCMHADCNKSFSRLDNLKQHQRVHTTSSHKGHSKSKARSVSS